MTITLRKKKKNLILAILSSLILGVCFSDSINLQLPTSLSSKNPSLRDFCHIIENNYIFTDGGGSIALDPRKSLFVKGLCWMKNGVQLELLKAPLAENYYSAAKLAQYVYYGKTQKEVCKEDFNGACDFLTFGEKLYTAVMSDIFRAKWSYVGLGPGKNAEESAAWQLNVIRVPSLWKSYEDWNKLYPKTIQMLKKNNKTFEKMQKKISMIDFNALTGERGSGLQGEGNGVSENPQFVNLVFNEYFWYNTFLLYERYIFSTSNISEKQKKYYNMKIEKMMEDSRKTLEVALEDLNGFARTYPLHIARVLYQESLLDLRNNYLSKLVTPIYTLYDKFRNVQPAE